MNIEKERKAFESRFKTTEIYSRECKVRNKDILAEFSATMGGYFNIVANESWQMWQAAKAQVPEGFVLVSAEQLNQWSHMANAAEQYGCCECFESRGYAHNLACEINSYFEPTVAQEQSNESN